MFWIGLIVGIVAGIIVGVGAWLLIYVAALKYLDVTHDEWMNGIRVLTEAVENRESMVRAYDEDGDLLAEYTFEEKE